MCDFTKGLKFCTCDPAKGEIVHNKKSRRNKDAAGSLPKEYVWRLDRYITTVDNGMIGSMIMPRENLGDGLTEEWVLMHLNLENCFDFDYLPEEGDILTINLSGDGYSYMSFIFKQEKWVADIYIDFGTVLEEHNRGVVKPVEPEGPQE